MDNRHGGKNSTKFSALAHIISYDTNLPLRTVLLFVTAKLADAIRGVAPLVHPGTVLQLQHWRDYQS